MTTSPFERNPDPFAEEGFSSSTSQVAPLKRDTSLVIFTVPAILASLLAVLLYWWGVVGYGAVGMAALGYVLAVLADTQTRRTRYDQRNFVRPKLTTSLRVATFLMALLIGWLVASNLAGS